MLNQGKKKSLPTAFTTNSRSNSPSPSVKADPDSQYETREVAREIKKPKKRKRLIIKNDDYKKFVMFAIEVRMPLGFELYHPQRLIIARILTALKASDNVLAESPTGSGKTMALLISTCAWLRQYIEDKREARERCEIHGTTRGVKSEVEEEQIDVKPGEYEEIEDVKPDIAVKSEDNFENQWVDDFVPHSTEKKEVKKEKVKIEKVEPKEPKADPVCTCPPRVRIYYGTRTHKQIAQVVKEFSRLPYANIIKLVQFQRPLSKIKFQAHNSSKSRAVLHPSDRQATTRHFQYCKEINSANGIGCSFKTAMRNRYEKPAALRDYLQNNGTVVFDIEEVVQTLATSSPQLCPYFCTNRILTQDADLIFCPFTYLVDPIIRNSSDVHLTDSIVILDEAHNIEDTCAESASFTFTEKELDDSLISLRVKRLAIDKELSGKPIEAEFTQIPDREKTLKEMRDHMMALDNLIMEIYQWIRVVSQKAITKKNGRNGGKTCTLSASSLFSSLTNVEHGIDLFTPKDTPKFNVITNALNAVLGKADPEDQYFDQFKPNAIAIVFVEKWLYFQVFYSTEKYRDTYRLNVTIDPINETPFKKRFDADESMISYSQRSRAGPRNNRYKEEEDFNSTQETSSWVTDMEADQWIDPSVSQTGHQPISEGCRTTVSFWCMSPAISFLDAFAETRSVILASGTLCPMDTLKTELGTDFKFQVEGSQVIEPDNYFAAVIPAGPFGNRLNCTYRNTSDPQSPFYKEVGAIIKYVCMNVASGILVFLPSYRVLEELKTCMANSSVLRQVEMKKMVLFEPRRSSELAGVIEAYDEAITNPTKFGHSINGAVMFAVFRGKVSEGIDFADDRCRVVISVGIPFPNSVDERVMTKKQYNDQNCAELGILKGDEWYVTQAYRALNQALGRCLRHKNDWGAMLIIDERLERQAGQLTGGASSARISKWICDKLKSYPDFRNLDKCFREFMLSRTVVKEEQSVDV